VEIKNPYEICNCPIPNCGCSLGMQSYVDVYADLIRTLRPQLVLEWGPGRNTIMALQSGARVVSIESEKRWIPDGANQRWTCILAQERSPDYLRLWGCDDADIFFVDGRRRSECLAALHLMCKPSAVVCLHDAQRIRYQKALGLFDFVEFRHRGFAVASKIALPPAGGKKHVA